MMTGVAFLVLAAPAEGRQRVKFQYQRLDATQAPILRLLDQLRERGEAAPARWIVVSDDDLFEQEQVLADAHERRLFPLFLELEVCQGLVKEREEFAEQQRDAHGVCFLRVDGQERMLAFGLAQASGGQGKLQAGAGK